tara:strand:- start:1272 stop:2267 length:996 start_codon:yes stop_codon:yes gene_type:complete
MTYGTSFILSKENILKKIGEFELFQYYEPNFTDLKKKFCSTWRGEKVPSAIIRDTGGTLFYRDYGDSISKSYAIWAYLMARYNLTYNESLQVVANDFGLIKLSKPITREILGIVSKKEIMVTENVELKIGIKSKEWSKKNIKYWEDYGVSMDTIKHFNKIVPISHYFFNDKPFQCKKDENSFAYREGIHKYKIYLPERPKGSKWWSNTGSIVQGLDKIPEKGDLLFITSSYKDIHCLYDLDKYNAIAPHCENALIDLKIIENLKTRFKRILLYYNNDEAGVRASIAHSEIYGLDWIVNPPEMEKDPSDVVLMYDREVLRYIIDELVNDKRK